MRDGDSSEWTTPQGKGHQLLGGLRVIVHDWLPAGTMLVSQDIWAQLRDTDLGRRLQPTHQAASVPRGTSE